MKQPHVSLYPTLSVAHFRATEGLFKEWVFRINKEAEDKGWRSFYINPDGSYLYTDKANEELIPQEQPTLKEESDAVACGQKYLDKLKQATEIVPFLQNALGTKGIQLLPDMVYFDRIERVFRKPITINADNKLEGDYYWRAHYVMKLRPQADADPVPVQGRKVEIDFTWAGNILRVYSNILPTLAPKKVKKVQIPDLEQLLQKKDTVLSQPTALAKGVGLNTQNATPNSQLYLDCTHYAYTEGYYHPVAMTSEGVVGLSEVGVTQMNSLKDKEDVVFHDIFIQLFSYASFLGTNITEFIKIIEAIENTFTEEQANDVVFVSTQLRKCDPYYNNWIWNDQLIPKAKDVKLIVPAELQLELYTNKVATLSDGLLFHIGHTFCGLDAGFHQSSVNPMYNTLLATINNNLDATTWIGDLGTFGAKLFIYQTNFSQGYLSKEDWQLVVNQDLNPSDLMGDIFGYILYNKIINKDFDNPFVVGRPPRRLSEILKKYFIDEYDSTPSTILSQFCKNIGLLGWNSSTNSFANESEWIKRYASDLRTSQVIVSFRESSVAWLGIQYLLSNELLGYKMAKHILLSLLKTIKGTL